MRHGTRTTRRGPGGPEDGGPHGRPPGRGDVPRDAGGEEGFSLVELMISLLVLSLVATSALGLFRTQGEGFRRGADQFTVVQNARFAVNALEKDLPTAGSHVVDGQPHLVYADSTTVAFNADFASNDVNDVWAVYREPGAPAEAVTSLPGSRQIQIPGTSFDYPDTTYTEKGTNSPAETLVFFFTPDSTTGRPDDFALFRQTNDREPELVARNLLRPDEGPFLEYVRIFDPPASPAWTDTVPRTEYPLRHTAPVHLSPGDTGAGAVIDSVRAVRVRVVATNGAGGTGERTQGVSRLVRLPNAGVTSRRTCGDEPLLGVGLGATGQLTAGGDPSVELSWSQATDEAGGEEDVTRYVLYRRVAGASSGWGDPLLSIPSGNASYTYTDTQVTGGETYDYALQAQDCTPSLSSRAVATGVTVPTP